MFQPVGVGVAEEVGAFDERDHLGHGVVGRGEKNTCRVGFGGEEVLDDDLGAGVEGVAVVRVDKGEIFAEERQGDGIVVAAEGSVDVALEGFEEGDVEGGDG